MGGAQGGPRGHRRRADRSRQPHRDARAHAGGHERLIAAGFEGSVYKRRSSPYRCGQRSASWLKRKARQELDVVVRPFITREGIVERVSCALTVDGELAPVGYAEVWRSELREQLARHPDKSSGHRASVSFSSVSARGELREARLTVLESPEPVPDLRPLELFPHARGSLSPRFGPRGD